MTNKLYFK